MILQELDHQLDANEAALLRGVLADLAAEVAEILATDLAGMYLTGSFALGAGDVHADVDFQVVTGRPLGEAPERAIRALHATFPDRPEHWARNLEGSYATVDDLLLRADTSTPWLYVDNGSRGLEWTSHDNTEVARLRDNGEDRNHLRNACGQPHEVLTSCRMLVTATRAEVVGKAAAGRWCQGVLPVEWHDLIERAIRDRPDPWQRVHRAADPSLAARTWEFVQLMTPRIVEAASGAWTRTFP